VQPHRRIVEITLTANVGLYWNSILVIFGLNVSSIQLVMTRFEAGFRLVVRSRFEWDMLKRVRSASAKKMLRRKRHAEGGEWFSTRVLVIIRIVWGDSGRARAGLHLRLFSVVVCGRCRCVCFLLDGEVQRLFSGKRYGWRGRVRTGASAWPSLPSKASFRPRHRAVFLCVSAPLRLVFFWVGAMDDLK